MTDPMSVVLIGPAHPLRGGLATFNERLIREYLKRGDMAKIVTFSLQYPSLFFPGKTQFSTEPPPGDIPISIKVNAVNPLNWIRVGMGLKKQRPDLVLVKYWMPFMAPCFGTICRIIKRNRHTRVISIIDNIIPHEKRLGDRFLSQFWVNSADGFVVMSRSVLIEMDTFTGKLPKVYCPHPLYDNFGEILPREVALKQLNLDPRFRYILFFGFIRDYKGLDLLLHSFHDARVKASGIKLLVAGEFYCDSKPYYDLIQEYQLQDQVIMSNDFIPDSQVRNYFCAADLVVQPYKSATQSGVTQIAYHFNKPMIITNVGGLAEFVPDNKVGFVVEPSPEEISTAIMKFYSEGREAEFSSNAAVEKQKYSWGRMLETIDKLMLYDHPK